MRGIGAVVFGVVPLLAMTAAWAQSSPAGSPAPFQGTVRASPFVPSQSTRVPPLPPQIGTLFGVPVRVWAPVEAPNNQLADRNGAADPLLPNAPPWWGG